MDRKTGKLAAIAVIVLSAIALIIAFDQTWYSWKIPETRGSGDVPAWNAWPEEFNHAYVVAAFAAITALLSVFGVRDQPRTAGVAAVFASLTVLGVVWLILDPYTIPVDPAFSTFNVTVEPAALIGLAAALVMLATTLYIALGDRAPQLGSMRLAVISALVLGIAVIGATTALGESTARYQFYVQGIPTDQKCAEAQALVTDGAYNRGKAESVTWALTSKWVYPPNCKALQSGRANGTISTRWVYQVRIGGSWQGCDSTNLQKNLNGDPLIDVWRNYTQHPCGSNHYYRTQGYHGYLSGSSWKNADRATPSKWFG